MKYGKKAIEVVLLSLTNSTANTIVGEKETPVKTINVGVKTNENLFDVLRLKNSDQVELVRYPVKEELKIESIEIDQSKVNTKTITLKNGVMLYVD